MVSKSQRESKKLFLFFLDHLPSKFTFGIHVLPAMTEALIRSTNVAWSFCPSHKSSKEKPVLAFRNFSWKIWNYNSSQRCLNNKAAFTNNTRQYYVKLLNINEPFGNLNIQLLVNYQHPVTFPSKKEEGSSLMGSKGHPQTSLAMTTHSKPRIKRAA